MAEENIIYGFNLTPDQVAAFKAKWDGQLVGVENAREVEILEDLADVADFRQDPEYQQAIDQVAANVEALALSTEDS
jgi:hypothetical protein